MNLDEALPGFVAESGDLLREMEAGLLQCSGPDTDPETINLIFRSAHTIKGSAGLFGLDGVVAFVHVMETALDLVRLGRAAMSDELVSLLLSCKDHVESLLVPVGSAGASIDPEVEARGAELLTALRKVTEGASAPGAKPASDASTNVVTRPAVAATADWHVRVRFGAGVLASGMDPLGFIRYLQTFCEILELQVLDDTLPAPPDMDPEVCYLGFELDLRTASGQANIESAFEFVREDCTLTVTPKGPAAGVPATAAAAAVPAPTVAASSARDGAASEPAKKVAGNDAGAASAYIRVDALKLDSLITRIGELIISAAGTNLLARRAGNSELEESTSTLSGLVEQVREAALQLRMVKIGGTFNRFQRTVHDVSRELGKEIQLVVRGEDTELDKTII